MTMIDFVTVTVPCELPFPIDGGMLIDHDEDGQIRFAIRKHLAVEGSFSGKMMLRAISVDELELSGNPAKFLAGHNIYGSDNLRSVIARCLEVILTEVCGYMPYVNIGKGKLTRVDVTDGYILDRPDDVTAYLRALSQTARIAYKGRGVLEESTLVFGRSAKGQRAKDWQIVMYAKGLEVAKRPLPPIMMEDEEVRDWVARLLRVEVRLRSRELERLGLKSVKSWDVGTAAEIWADKIGKLDMSEVRELKTEELEHVKPRLRCAYAAWRHGEDLAKGMKRASFYRLRRELKDNLGVDIAVPVPKSNVVPLVRVLEARPAMRPSWADRIDRALSA